MARPRIIMSDEEIRSLPRYEVALEAGLKYYFEGECTARHLSRFNVLTKQCAECVRLRATQHYLDNTENKKSYQRNYAKRTHVPKPRAAANPVPYWIRAPEACRVNARKCYANNRLTYVAKAARYRARKKNAPGNGITGEQGAEILKRQGGKCAYCHSKVKLELDHIIPLARGGEHATRNAQWLCKPCNSKKNSKDPIDFSRSLGLLL